MIIGLALSILLILTVLSIILGNDFTGSLMETTIDNEALVDGVSSTFEIEGTNLVFNIDPVIGAIVILIAIIVLSAIIGIQILGSGISPESIRIIIHSVLYGGLWGILSALSMNLIISIEIFGSLIYIVLTIVYVIGVIDKLGGSE